MQNLLILSGLAALGSIAGLIGGVIFLLNRRVAHSLTTYAVPFAAGVLLAVSFLDLLPEAVEIYENSFVLILVIFVLLFLIEKLFFHLHHHEEEGGPGSKNVVSMVLFGDTIHNFLDGITIGASFIISPPLGLLVALATFSHETPHEVADFALLLSVGWSRKKAFFANFLSALATFPGAFLAFYLGPRIESLNGALLAVAAGFFLYVSTTDFLPESKTAEGKSAIKSVVFLVLGVVLIAAVKYLLPEV